MGMLRSTWHVLPRPGGRGTLPKVEIDGPAVDDLVRHVAEQLATSIHDRDGRAAAWTDYVLAMSNQAAAIESGTEGVTMDDLDAAVDAAWDALAEDLPRVLRLSVVEAQLIAHGIDHAVGRVGTAWEAA